MKQDQIKNFSLLVVSLLLGCLCICPPLFAGNVKDKEESMRKLIRQVKSRDAVKVGDDFALSVFSLDQVVNENKVYLPISVIKSDGYAGEIQSVFLFNEAGEGVELQQFGVYGENVGSRSVSVELWFTDLMASGGYTPYVYWSTGATGGITRLPPQHFSVRKRGVGLSELKNTGVKDEKFASCIRSYGNLRRRDGLGDLCDVLTNNIDRQTKDACLIALARVVVPDDNLGQLLNERNISNADMILKDVGRLQKAFRKDAPVSDLLEVSAADNAEAKAWVALRLAYMGEKDALKKIPLGMSWSRMMRFQMAAGSLADVRRDEKQK